MIFNKEEIEDIIRHQGEDSLRDPVNEDPYVQPVTAPTKTLTAKEKKAIADAEQAEKDKQAAAEAEAQKQIDGAANGSNTESDDQL